MNQAKLNTNTELFFDKSLDEMKCEKYNSETGNKKYYDCPLCKNRGYTMVIGDNGCPVFKECECMKIRESKKQIEKAGLSDLVKRCTFENYAGKEPWQQEVKKQALAFIKDYSEKWFFIGGQTGCGKTHICTAIVSLLIEKDGRAARYMKWRDEITKIKNVANDEGQENLKKEWKDAEVLYIDDFFKTGGENQTTADINLAYEILNHRYNKRFTTIISSEMAVDDILKIDEATGGRIIECTDNKKYCLTIARDENKNMRLK